jgi:hypothetical protein
MNGDTWFRKCRAIAALFVPYFDFEKMRLTEI